MLSIYLAARQIPSVAMEVSAFWVRVFQGLFVCLLSLFPFGYDDRTFFCHRSFIEQRCYNSSPHFKIFLHDTLNFA